MDYTIKIIWNNNEFIRYTNNQTVLINFTKNVYIPSIIYTLYENVIRIMIFHNNNLVFDSLDVRIPKKLYKIYSFKNKKLFSYNYECDNYIIFIDIIFRYNIKYLKDVYIMKK